MKIFSIKPTLAALCLAAVALGSCYDDKGNYDYTDLPEVVIDTTGTSIRETYAITRYDTLRLEPNILLDGKRVNDDSSAPLDYVWTLYTANTGAYVTYITDTIGTKPKLEAPITPVAGAYTVQLTVKNRETGVERYFQVSCQVEGSLLGGWMVAYECADEPGYTDIGLVLNPKVKKNIDGDKSYWDLYKSSNGTHLEGLPKRIIRPIQKMASGEGTDVVYCLTDKTLAVLNNVTFETAGSFADLFYSAPENENVAWFGPCGTMMQKFVMLNDNKIYTVNFSSGPTNQFGVGKSGDFGTLADWTCDIPYFYYDAVVYDQTNGCFYNIPRNGVSAIQFGAQDPNAAFDVNNVGMTMLMSDWGRGSASYSNAYEYSLMQKGSERWLTISNFNTTYSDTRIGLGAYNITESPDIDKATSMSAAYLGEYVLYGAGSKVYNLKYNSSTVAEPVWTAPSSDEEVTCVRLQKYYFMTLYRMMLPNPNTVVHIATWNEKTKEGKLYEYTIDPASGAISGEPYTYTVPGKVKDMAWKYLFER